MDDNKCIISGDIEKLVALMQVKKDTLNSLAGFAERVQRLYDCDQQEAIDVLTVVQGFIFGYIDSNDVSMSRKAFFEQAEETLKKYAVDYEVSHE